MTGIHKNGVTNKAREAYRLICWIVIPTIIILAIFCFVTRKTSPSFKAPATPLVGATFEDLLDAICWVESRSDANAIGDKILRDDLCDSKGVIFIPFSEQVNCGKTLHIEGNLVYEYQAIGAYQIHKKYVDDVNKILKGWKKEIWTQIKEAGGKGLGGWFVPYTYEDRFNKEHSREMARVYLTYYTPLNDDLDIDLEKAAAIHCAGPDGWKQIDEPKIKAYIEKVKTRMEAVK